MKIWLKILMFSCLIPHHKDADALGISKKMTTSGIIPTEIMLPVGCWNISFSLYWDSKAWGFWKQFLSKQVSVEELGTHINMKI